MERSIVIGKVKVGTVSPLLKQQENEFGIGTKCLEDLSKDKIDKMIMKLRLKPR